MSKETEHISPNGPDPRLPWYKRGAEAVHRGVSWIKQAAAGILVLAPDKIRKEQLATGRVDGQNGIYDGFKTPDQLAAMHKEAEEEQDRLASFAKRVASLPGSETGPSLTDMLNTLTELAESLYAYITGQERKKKGSDVVEISLLENAPVPPADHPKRGVLTAQNDNNGNNGTNGGQSVVAVNALNTWGVPTYEPS